MSQPVCSVSWCIGVPKSGASKCPVHLRMPNYEPVEPLTNEDDIRDEAFNLGHAEGYDEGKKSVSEYD